MVSLFLRKWSTIEKIMQEPTEKPLLQKIIFCDQGSFSEDSTHFLLGVSAKHLSDDVSTTVSQKATTGSATLMSGGGRKRESRTCVMNLEP